MRTTIARAALLAPLLLAACAIQQPRSTAQTTYDLRPAQLAAVPEAQLARPQVVHVLPVDPAPGLDGAAMLYSSRPGLVQAYRDSRWLAPPAELVRSAIARTLAHQPWVAAVEQDAPLTSSDLTLHCALDRLDHDVSSRPGRVHLELECELAREGSAGIESHWFAGGELVLERDDAAHAAAAQQQLLDAALSTIVERVGAAAAR